jgi:hypothetical protein
MCRHFYDFPMGALVLNINNNNNKPQVLLYIEIDCHMWARKNFQLIHRLSDIARWIRHPNFLYSSACSTQPSRRKNTLFPATNQLLQFLSLVFSSASSSGCQLEWVLLLTQGGKGRARESSWLLGSALIRCNGTPYYPVNTDRQFVLCTTHSKYSRSLLYYSKHITTDATARSDRQQQQQKQRQ